MKRFMAKVLAVSVFALCLSTAAAAVDFDAGWGRGLDDNDVSARAYLKNAASRICRPDDGDREKVRKLNAYVCDKAAYDYSHASGSLSDFVDKGKAVCSGYAEALAYLLDCVNVKNFTVTAFVNAGNNLKTLHIWNAVYIDGEWLHVDPTWNDATRNEKNPDGKYFLATSAQIGAGRLGLPPNAPGEYDRLYALLKTATVSLHASDTPAVSVDESAPPDALMMTHSPMPASYVPAEPEAPGTGDGGIWVPVREAVYALGGYVKEEACGRVTVILGTKTLAMTIGSDQGYIDGEAFTLGAVPQMVGGRAVMPARTALEKLGAKVGYDAATCEVTVFYDPYIGPANAQPPQG